MTCVVCDLIKKGANKLFDTENVFVMLSPEPVSKGHVWVVPKAHFPIFESVPENVVSELFVVANKIGISAFESLGAKGTNLLIQNGPTAGQSHNHFLLNVIPRNDNDKVNLAWTPKKCSDEELSAVEKSLKEEPPAPKPEQKPAVKDDYRLKNLRRIP